nr:hypothetical protein [Jatrophihabitans endophyticus]
MSTLPAGAVARVHRSLDPLHSMLYFSPEQDEELTAIGLRPGRMCYFASRSAPMGPVTGGVTTATFYNFSPSLVAHNIPRAWTLATVEDILAARLRAVDRALTRLLGADTVASPELAEAASLARRACEGLDPTGRPLYAAHADLPWPDAPHLVLWHAITLLREHRGDGHIAALVEAQLGGLDALITHTATGRGFTVAAAKATRGWSDDEWDAGVADLRGRGLLDDSGLTADGEALRASVEDVTDRLATRPWSQLGADDTARLTELGRTLSKQIAAAGAWPDGVFGRPR